MHCFSDNGNRFSIRVGYTVRQLYFNNVSPVPCDRILKALCGQHGMAPIGVMTGGPSRRRLMRPCSNSHLLTGLGLRAFTAR